MNSKSTLSEAERDRCASFAEKAKTHFPPQFLNELGRADDDALMFLLGELLETSPGSPIEWSEDVYEELFETANAYQAAFDNLKSTIETIKGRRNARFDQRVSDEEFDYRTGQVGNRYYA